MKTLIKSALFAMLLVFATACAQNDKEENNEEDKEDDVGF